MFEFHVSRSVRDRCGFADTLFALSGNVIFANLAASREFAHRLNAVRDAERHPERVVHPAALHAMGLIDEALHVVMEQYRRQRDPRAMLDALSWFTARLGGAALDQTLLSFAQLFPTVAIYRGRQTASEWLAGSTDGVPHRAIVLEELVMLWLANLNPAFRRFQELFDDQPLARGSAYLPLTTALHEYFAGRPRFGDENQNLIDLMRAPALAAPDSLEGQLAFIREKWAGLLGDLMSKLVSALGALKEEEIAIWMRFHPPSDRFGGQLRGDSSAAAVPRFGEGDHEYEHFTPDKDWMPRAVVMAKSVYVWLDQLSRTYKRAVHRLDQIPDEELDLLARRGFNGLWLIGLWERSRASQRIKQMCGNPEAAASAYSLCDYTIAEDLGGEQACANLRDRAWLRGIRLASDMVPNHMGIDSRWVMHHPDWFISLPWSPFPAYSFNGPNVASEGATEIKIEDHYYDRTDAAVVFRRVDHSTGDTRFIYHGNDGTSFPWNDTAQLNYLRGDVREAVIQTILHVARMFPIIRFDAAMTLAKRHYQRLWYPEPGTGGSIPSRSEHGMTKAQFDAAMPVEFWREVVDRIAVEAPNTLLLAEAFWLMEGYFVRTLGMHRVYNSAFMNMLRDEENANYRSVIKNTLAFDPEVLKRYVNFMNNPDERTAVDQFGKGDKYFGVCTMMATLPGLPMFGHGQIEGFTERYGMEYRRAYHDEQPDPWLVARHEREISPLLHRRHLFAEVRDFLLFDFFTDQGHVNEDVFAYSNRSGDERALVVFNNRYASTRGWIRVSCAYAEKTSGGKHMRQRTLGESFGFTVDPACCVAYRDAFTGLEYLHRSDTVTEQGLHVELRAYQTNVLLDWRDLRDDAEHPWTYLCHRLGGRGVQSLDDALRDLQLEPVHNALRALMDPALAETLAGCAAMQEGAARAECASLAIETVRHRAKALLEGIKRYGASGAGRAAGINAEKSKRADESFALDLVVHEVEMALRLPTLYRRAHARWSEDAHAVLPLGDRVSLPSVGVWRTVLAWCALAGAGRLYDSDDPEVETVRIFDAMRFREPLAAAFATSGTPSEEHWRAAARVRASFALSVPSMAPFEWIHDPDVAWLIGVHPHEGVSYLVKEQFERLLWWMTLPVLLRIAGEQQMDPARLDLVKDEIDERMSVVETGGYKVEALESISPLDALRDREEKLQKETLKS